jgi:predicted DNA-binding protein with PD1-like motif
MPSKKDTSFAFRLYPGADLKNSIRDFVKEKNILAGWVVSCAGSITGYSIRFANQPAESRGRGNFEIVSLTGTVSVNGLHLHISISDSTGKTIGGHLMEGCEIYTTAEIVLVKSGEYTFNRKKDGSTLWEELHITKK